MTNDPVSDLEADHAQQQQSREEGVEEQEVERVSGQRSRVALVNDLIPLSDQTGSRQRPGSICKNTKGGMSLKKSHRSHRENQQSDKMSAHQMDNNE